MAKEMKEGYRNMVSFLTMEKKGDGLRVLFEVKGSDHKQDLTFQPGVPLEYSDIDGSKITDDRAGTGASSDTVAG